MTIQAKVNRAKCWDCGGTGIAPWRHVTEILAECDKCIRCNGTGQEPGRGEYVTCPKCEGKQELETGTRDIQTGYAETVECPQCHGEGCVREDWEESDMERARR